MNTTQTPRKLTLTPHPALALYGDQTVTEVWFLYAGEVINRRSNDYAESGARPWLPFEFREAGLRALLTEAEFLALLDEQAAADEPFELGFADEMRAKLTTEQFTYWCESWDLCELHDGRDIEICWDDGLNCGR